MSANHRLDAERASIMERFHRAAGARPKMIPEPRCKCGATAVWHVSGGKSDGFYCREHVPVAWQA